MDFEKLYNRALRFLSFRPRSEKEVRDNLIRHSGKRSASRIHSVDSGQVDSGLARMTIIDQVIEKLKQQKFLNDEEFARWWIESRLKFKPRSIRLIKLELLHKGIDKDLIDAQISNFKFQISNELENAKILVRKKISKYRNLNKQELYQKLGGFLARRGFDWETVKQSIDEVIREGV